MDDLTWADTNDILKELSRRMDQLTVFGFKKLNNNGATEPIAVIKGSPVEIFGMMEIMRGHLFEVFSESIHNPFNGMDSEDFTDLLGGDENSEDTEGS